jgi:hypothetical protein
LLLSEDDFKELGVKIGHRKKILHLLNKSKIPSYNGDFLGNSVGEADLDTDLDHLILRLSGITGTEVVKTVADNFHEEIEGFKESADMDDYLAVLAKQLRD